MRVVVTRPLNRAESTATQLRAMGHEVMLLPLSEARHRTENAKITLGRTFPAIALTSAEALRALAGLDLSPHLETPLFAVGRKTATAAEQAGFKTVHIANGDGASLAALIAEHHPAEVIYLTGHPRSPTFETALETAKIPHSVVECYEMVPLEPSSVEVQALLTSSPGAVLFHSHETARLFFTNPAIKENLASFRPQVIACLSARVAEAVPPQLQGSVKIAERPDEACLLALL